MQVVAHSLKKLSTLLISVCLFSTLINAYADEMPIATLLGSPVYGEDLTVEDKVKAEMKKKYPQQYASIMVEMKKQLLAEKIIEGVLNDYFPQNVMALDTTLVAKFKARFKDDFTEQALSEKDVDKIAKDQVLQWQREKALYATFKGQVVFQQSNPLTPIEAYATLLKQYQQQGKFVIHDKEYADVFWAPFSQPYEFVIPEDNIDYAAPWWL